MANEHIGRLEKIGLGKESTSGTPVSAATWLPKTEGVFTPVVEKAKDESAYGTIDQLRDSSTVKQTTEVEIKGILRDVYGGHFLMAAFGQDTVTLKLTLASVVGSFTVGETVTQAVSSATGVVKRKEGSTIMYVTIASGTFTSGSNTITGGTSGATAVPSYETTLRSHYFQRLNTNNHPAYTMYGVDDVGTFRAPFCMLESLELELSVNGYLTYAAKYMGQKEASSSGTPSFTVEENHWLGKHANMYLASALSGLNAASATPISSLKLTIQKNLEAYQAWGSTDVASIHNKQFRVFGELTALFTATTLKDLVTAGTKKALRVKLVNTDVTVGSAANPELIIDMAQVSFESWDKQANNDELVMQTVGFEMEFSVDDAEGIVAFLQNTQTTAY